MSTVNLGTAHNEAARTEMPQIHNCLIGEEGVSVISYVAIAAITGAGIAAAIYLGGSLPAAAIILSATIALDVAAYITILVTAAVWDACVESCCDEGCCATTAEEEEPVYISTSSALREPANILPGPGVFNVDLTGNSAPRLNSDGWQPYNPADFEPPLQTGSNAASTAPRTQPTNAQQIVLPQIDENALKTLCQNYKLNPEHYAKIAQIQQSLPASPNVPTNKILDYFDEINFTYNPRNLEECSTDYVNPNSIQDDESGTTINKARARLNIVNVLQRMRENTAFTGTPSGNAARRTFFDGIETMIKHICLKFADIQTDHVYRRDSYGNIVHIKINELIYERDAQGAYVPKRDAQGNVVHQYDENGNQTPVYVEKQNAALLIAEREKQIKEINQRNGILLRIGAGCGHCAGRVVTEVQDGFTKMVLGLNLDALESALTKRLHDARLELVKGILLSPEFINGFNRVVIENGVSVNQRVNGFGRVDGTYHSHAVAALMQKIAPDRGILGSQFIDYTDPFSGAGIGIQRLTKEQALYLFDKEYSPERIVRMLKDMIDGIPSATGGMYREVDTGFLINWFKAHIAPGWKEGERPIAMQPETDLDGNAVNDENGHPKMEPKYDNHAEQFLYEFVFEKFQYNPADEYAVLQLIKPEAVIYMLKEIGILADKQTA